MYVSDTHCLLWWMTGTRALGKNAARVFARAERGLDEIHLPTVVLFELALLVERGRFLPALGWNRWVESLEAKAGLRVDPLTVQDVGEARHLAALVDPFDRMIAATALRLDCPLLTSDQRITDSGLVRTVW